MTVSFQKDVVDQAGRADPGGDREGRPVEVGHGDIVRLHAGLVEDPAGTGNERPFAR